MDRAFISYRRDDTSGTVHQFKDALGQYLGPTRVFLDTADLEYGEPFRPAVRAAIEQASVTFVLIGPRWLDPTGAHRSSRAL